MSKEEPASKTEPPPPKMKKTVTSESDSDLDVVVKQTVISLKKKKHTPGTDK